LIFRKIIKIDATMSYFKAKIHKIRFPLGLCPRPRWGAYSGPQTRYLDIKGPTSKGREGRKDGRERQGRGLRRGGRKGRG